MEHRPGFTLYGVVFIFGVFSLFVAMYFIQLRAKEFIFYKELARQRTVGYSEFILCGGPENMSCEKGYTCEIIRSKKYAFGKCVKDV